MSKPRQTPFIGTLNQKCEWEKIHFGIGFVTMFDCLTRSVASEIIDKGNYFFVEDDWWTKYENRSVEKTLNNCSRMKVIIVEIIKSVRVDNVGSHCTLIDINYNDEKLGQIMPKCCFIKPYLFGTWWAPMHLTFNL